MSDVQDPPSAEPSTESEYLRRNWHPEILGQYEDQWIAVKGDQIISADAEFAAVFEATVDQDPLYAFVTFDDMQ